ncbi:hypothetical protein PAXINDRAFT_171618, partial [Paxillus involutus ATCC 200175]
IETKMPLLRNALYDDTMKHFLLDKRVNDSVEGDLDETDKTLSRTGCITLLSAIVACSYGELNYEYKKWMSAKALIIKHPELTEMLDTAWKYKSYGDIRNLVILQVEKDSDDGEYVWPLTGKMKAELGLSLTKPYRGAAVDAFYEYLEQNQKDFSGGTNYYARYCSIVQSSGTGKTRLMLELAKKGVLVLYINLRPKDDRTGFPPRDSIPADILTSDLKETSANHYEARCCAFFASVFRTILEVLSAYVQQGCPDPIKQWNDRMCDLSSPYRTQFFERLLDVYDELERGGSDGVTASMGKYRFEHSDRVHLMTAAYATMRSSLPWLFTKDNTPKLAIALDEAHPLHETTKFHPATILCSIINLYSKEKSDLSGVWVVFASTALKVAHFLPLRDKRTVGEQLVFAPFSQLGWDQFADPLNAIPATDVAKLSHIIGYGRPLFSISLVTNFVV